MGSRRFIQKWLKIRIDKASQLVILFGGVLKGWMGGIEPATKG